jgi:hypothetical protein
MTVTSITLTDPASGFSVPILPADGVAAQVLDVAAPARAVTEDRTGAAGGYDTTRYSSAAAVSLTLLLYPGVSQSPEEFLDLIGALLNPALRPWLIVGNDQWAGPRQLTIRYDSISKPLSDPTNQPVQITWQAPAGTWEDASLSVPVVNAFIASSTGLIVSPAATGFAYTATNASPCVFTAAGSAFANGAVIALSGGTPPAGVLAAGEPVFQNGKDYFAVGVSGTTFKLDTNPAGTGLGSTSTGNGTATAVTGISVPAGGVVIPATSAPSPSQVTSGGNATSQWTARLYGPCTAPALANDTAGATLEFTDSLTLAPGAFVALDSAARTAYLNGDPSQSVLGFLSFATSDWWLIQPGANIIRFYPDAAGAGSQAQLSFRSAWSA